MSSELSSESLLEEEEVEELESSELDSLADFRCFLDFRDFLLAVVKVAGDEGRLDIMVVVTEKKVIA